MANKYKVLKDFVLNGITQTTDSVIELSYNQEQLKSIRDCVEKLANNDPLVLEAKKNASTLDGIKPGEQLTQEQKEKLAKENIVITEEANRLAMERRAADQVEGKGEPTVKVVAEALKEKLVNEEFEKKSE